MAEIRVRVAYERRELVDRLKGPAGPFETMADVLVFAAALGASEDVFLPIEKAAHDGIRLEVFARRNYRVAMDLLAVQRSTDAVILGDSPESRKGRVEILEGYSTGGLGILERELAGVLDSELLVELLLIMDRANEDAAGSGDADGFDLKKFLRR